MNTALKPTPDNSNDQSIIKSQEFLRSSRTNELFIAVVGPAGSGVGTAASVLKGFLELQKVDEVPYEVKIIKASDEIKSWATANGRTLPPTGRKTLSGMIAMQDLGDDMRFSMKDNSAVARAVMGKIRDVRSEASGKAAGELDGKPRVYVIDSLRHPAEAHLLRRIYRDAFTLLGVVCDPDVREARLRKNLYDFKEQQLKTTKSAVAEFIDRDADHFEKHGQHVTDTFQEADFFIDNSVDTGDISNTNMNEALRRFVNLVTSAQIVRPSLAETAMHHAHSAQLRSACLSRQVGAALVDSNGNIIATGANEVPMAGAVYMEENSTGML